MALYDFLKWFILLKLSDSSENRNLELITIRFDVGHPVYEQRADLGSGSQGLEENKKT